MTPVTALSKLFDTCHHLCRYDRLAAGNLDDIRGYISGLSIDYHHHTARCKSLAKLKIALISELVVENHDEPRAASFFGSNWRADAAALVTMTLPGMRFYFQGQREGYRNKLDVHLR